MLIDLGLPAIPGHQVAQEMRRTDPQVSTILITGWELDAADARLQPFDFHIKKPLGSIDEVGRVVAQALVLRNTRSEGGEKAADDPGSSES